MATRRSALGCQVVRVTTTFEAAAATRGCATFARLFGLLGVSS